MQLSQSQEQMGFYQ
ncbi:hypothetical protein BVRB_022540, partial [Beta vulgaris subsp. vulgaris]